MTYLQPHTRPSFFAVYRVLIAAMTVVVIGGLFALVGVYNALVSERHAAADAGEAIATLQSGNVYLEQQLLTVFDVNAVDAFASARGLVKERDPRYLEGTPATWALASASLY